MAVKRKQSGLTLIEITVVVMIMAVIAGFSMPAIRSFVDSMNSEAAVKSMIEATLSAGRAIAAKEQRYAGVRFQQDEDGNQYMIFIVQDYGKTGLVNGFCAVEGKNPVKLPDNIGVMDLTTVAGNGSINNAPGLTDATAFSILFSPAGKLVIHEVRVSNRDGKRVGNNSSDDDIFNTWDNINAEIGMFIQDDYDSLPDLGLGQEQSRRAFVIYDKAVLKKTNENRRWTDYLSSLKPVNINPYTGKIISAE